MKILQINNTDLPGKIFNGHDLQLSLNRMGIEAWQMVLDKLGEEKTTLEICSKEELIIRNRLTNLEKQLGMTNLLTSFAGKIINSEVFRKADIVHYHLIHNSILSLLDYRRIFSLKRSVWTIHDPWIVGGHCIYPLECEKWKTGCHDCINLDRPFFVNLDKTDCNWQIKKEAVSSIDCDIIVSTDWMKNILVESPIGKKFNRIHKIPFGLDIKKFKSIRSQDAREELGIGLQDKVIAFRAEEHVVKGLKYIIEALERLECPEGITILTIGTGRLPDKIIKRFHTIELGWQDEDKVRLCLAAADVFLMPSLAESFGLMAIEAMASKCAVIVFKDTVLEQVTYAPECGIAVKNRDAVELKEKLEYILKHDMERRRRAELGRKIVEQEYSYRDYVNRHIELYKEITCRAHMTENQSWGIYMENEKKQKTIVEKNMEAIKEFQKKLKELSNYNARKLCIFCAGIYGTKAYYDLKERLVEIAYVVDNNPEKWGTWLGGLECVGMERLEQEKDNVLVIVCNKNSQALINDLKEKNFPYVLSKQSLDKMLEGIPKIGDFRGIDKISELDYSSEGVKQLIDLFNRTINDICNYYEAKLK